MQLTPAQTQIAQSRKRFRTVNAGRVKFVCEKCGKQTTQHLSVYKKAQHHFCSISCGVSWRNKNAYNPSHFRDVSGEKNPMYGNGHKIAGNKNGMYGLTGAKCPNWKGGRSQRKDGYWRININGERKLEHRHILEQLGVDIKNKVVHHRNHNKSDNNVENLAVITQSEHINLHRSELCQ